MVAPSPLAFPLTVPQTARSGTVKTYLPSVAPKTVVFQPTLVWHPLLSVEQRSGKVKAYAPMTMRLQKVGSPPTRVWAPVVIFGHITPRPTYGQIWPRGTLHGPSA